jgi:hypothetical protein
MTKLQKVITTTKCRIGWCKQSQKIKPLPQN